MTEHLNNFAMTLFSKSLINETGVAHKGVKLQLILGISRLHHRSHESEPPFSLEYYPFPDQNRFLSHNLERLDFQSPV